MSRNWAVARGDGSGEPIGAKSRTHGQECRAAMLGSGVATKGRRHPVEKDQYGLGKQVAGWRKIAGLGVGLVVPGQFAGWNYGLARADWTDMMVATVLVAVLCLCLSLCVAELAATLPNAGGLYVYNEAAFGPLAGYVVGVAVFVALAVSSGAAGNSSRLVSET